MATFVLDINEWFYWEGAFILTSGECNIKGHVIDTTQQVEEDTKN